MDKSIVENWFVDSGVSEIHETGTRKHPNCHAWHVGPQRAEAFSFRSAINLQIF